MAKTEQPVVKGYVLENDFFNLSGGAQWTFAKKDGKDWFIKRFTDPVWPKDTGKFSAEYIEAHAREAKAFFNRKLLLYKAVNACDNGNIVTIRDFFLWDSKYHIVTERIYPDNIDVEIVARAPAGDKYLLLKTIASNIARLHEKGIVYADIRPDNILLKRSKTGKLIAKLIDFDGSFFEDSPPDRKSIPLSEQYIAPETGLVHFEGLNIPLTKKVDVFSLGLLFHLYWTGKLPDFNEKEYDFAFAALLEGGTLSVSPAIPAPLAGLIRRMLLLNAGDRPSMAQVVEELTTIMDPARAKQEEPPKQTLADTGGSSRFQIAINLGGKTKESGTSETGGVPDSGETLWSIPTDF